MISRRNLIRLGAASVGSLALRPFGLLPALAQSGSADYRALVCVFLYGGNDSNNMIVPADDTRYQQYQAIRGSLALSAADLSMVSATTGGVPYGFHPNLSELAGLFSSKELAIVANVGTLVNPITRSQYQTQAAPVPRNLFSHLDQQSQWQTSVPGGNSPTGWAGRVADLVRSQNSSTFPAFVSVSGNVLMGNGAQTQELAMDPGGSLDLPGFNSNSDNQVRLAALQNLLTTNTGMTLAQASSNMLTDALADSTMLDASLGKASLKTAFPSTGLGAQLQQVAEIIQVRDSLGMRRQIFFCSLGGFDTHQMQLGTHQSLYTQLSQAMVAFQSAMRELGTQNDVTTFTESDFSRTLQPASNDGSDHAWGGHHMIMGGAVKGGDIYGTFPTLQLGGPDDADTRGRWIPTTSVDQYGATLCSWFGIPDASLAQVFPNFANFQSKKLAFL